MLAVCAGFGFLAHGAAAAGARDRGVQTSSAPVELTRNGRTIALPHVSATRFAPTSGAARLHVLFSDRPLEGVTLATPFGEDHDAVVRWALDRDAIAAFISLAEGGDGTYIVTFVWGGATFAESGRGGGDGSRPLGGVRIASDRIAGDLSIAHPSGSLAGAFRAVIETIREVPFAAEGVAASRQAAVLRAYAHAMRALDVKAAQLLSASPVEREYHAARQEMGAKFVEQMIAERYADADELDRELASDAARIRESGDLAQIRVERSRKTALGVETRPVTFNFVRVGGAWKIR